MQHQAMTNEQILAKAPSIFAEGAHHGRSERYQFIPTIKVIDGLRNEGFEVYQAGESKARLEDKKGFTRHMVALRRNTDVERVQGDSIPQIILTNSHDGSGSYRVRAGMYRFVCMNGLVVAENEFQDCRVRHQGDVVGQVIEGAFTVVNDFERIIDTRNEWQALKLTHQERDAFAEAAQELRWEEVEEGDTSRRLFDPRQLLNAKRYADTRDDLWSTFNVVQENIIRGGSTYFKRNDQGIMRRGTTRAVKAVGDNLKLNSALWSLASKMAELKAA